MIEESIKNNGVHEDIFKKRKIKMKMLNKLFNIVNCVTLIIILGFVGGYVFGASNTEKRYDGDASFEHVIENVAADICGNTSGSNRLQAEVDSLTFRLEQQQAENAELKRLLAEEKEKGVMSKMGDNLSDAWDGAVTMWKDITD